MGPTTISLFYSHVVRVKGTANTTLQSNVEGERSRGRPARQWLDNVKEWTGSQRTIIMVWRKYVRVLTPLTERSMTFKIMASVLSSIKLHNGICSRHPSVSETMVCAVFVSSG